VWPHKGNPILDLPLFLCCSTVTDAAKIITFGGFFSALPASCFLSSEICIARISIVNSLNEKRTLFGSVLCQALNNIYYSVDVHPRALTPDKYSKRKYS
jgi:hypothetical protein